MVTSAGYLALLRQQITAAGGLFNDHQQARETADETAAGLQSCLTGGDQGDFGFGQQQRIGQAQNSFQPRRVQLPHKRPHIHIQRAFMVFQKIEEALD